MAPTGARSIDIETYPGLVFGPKDNWDRQRIGLKNHLSAVEQSEHTLSLRMAPTA